MTLVDIRQALGLSLNRSTLHKAMVVEADEIVAGIAIDEVLDITYLPLDQMAPLPATLPTSSTAFFKGTASYGNQILSVLDVPKILSSPAITVDEEVL